ncbi:MAG: 4-hydroxy-tetrahydrodipicolinate synthase [Oscillospiraceae bacterium]|jgi:4-hydroxy-tetrahydrodipicolinate synthase|nr:4-hydroxy-tetrahydrodipicolinate synthase [Oscillospiraceae bacterium]
MKNTIFKGSAVALVTPMKSDLDIDFKTLGRIIEFQIRNNIDAIVLCGTTGESATLTNDEKIQIIKYSVRKINKRVPLIVGTGSNNTENALFLSLKAQNLGADALLIVTPYYNKTSQNGLIEHYNYIANNVKIPIILYNVPSRTGCNIEPETYKILSKHERIVATKEASGDLSKLAKTISLCQNNLDIYCGNDDQIIPTLSLGAAGIISVFANAFPLQSHKIVEYYSKGYCQKSLNLFFSSLKVINSLFLDVNPIPIKTAMNFLDIPCGKCRLPLCDLNVSHKKKLKNAFEEYIKKKII